MKPGGSVIVRDYGLYDYAMIRFEPGHKLAENAYVRQDGTRSYYFSEGTFGCCCISAMCSSILFSEALRHLFTDCENGFDCKTCIYVCKETVNRKEDIHVPRIFVQGRFIKR